MNSYSDTLTVFGLAQAKPAAGAQWAIMMTDSKLSCSDFKSPFFERLPVSGSPVLKLLFNRFPKVSYTLFALNSPYAKKDFLKTSKYRWDGTQKVWHRTVVGKQSFEEEALWLKNEIYGGRPAKIDVVERASCTRSSRKPLSKATLTI